MKQVEIGGGKSGFKITAVKFNVVPTLNMEQRQPQQQPEFVARNRLEFNFYLTSFILCKGFGTVIGAFILFPQLS
jgi:hypothetical protein